MKKLFYLITFTIIANLSFATNSELESSSDETANYWLAVYHPIYQWNDVQPENVPWTRVSHLILGQLWPIKVNGGYSIGLEPGSYWAGGWGGWAKWTNLADKYIEKGHENHRKVCCMLGGAGSNPGNIWNNASSNENVAVFAKNISDVLQKLGFDGVDIDWEDNVEYPKMVKLVKEIRKAWPNATITIPTRFNGGDAKDLVGAKDAVDAFMPMSYLSIDQWGGWSIPSPLTPLYSVGHNSNGIEDALNKFLAQGIPASKVVMGVGGYGAVWGDKSGDGQSPIEPYANKSEVMSGNNNALPQGETSAIATDNVVTWKFLKNLIANNPNLKEDWDPIGKCSYWHTSSTNERIDAGINGGKVSIIFYESPRSMQEKVNFITTKQMKGMMFWTLSQLMDGNDSPILDATSSLSLDIPNDTIDIPNDTSDIPNDTLDTSDGTDAITSISLGNQTEHFKIGPNPCHGYFTIQATKGSMPIEYSIVTISGKLITRGKLDTNELRTFDFSQKQKGMYLLILKNSRFSKTEKIIIH